MNLLGGLSLPRLPGVLALGLLLRLAR